MWAGALPAAAVAALCFVALACGNSGTGPQPKTSGVLRVSAADLDGASPGIVPAGFDDDDVTSFRIRLLAGTEVVLDSLFARVGPVERALRVPENTYVIEVEAFQSGDVLVSSGAGQATVAAGDTVPVVVDLDPALGAAEVTIAGASAATVPTNGSAPVRVVVRNDRGQPVAGASVELSVSPAAAALVEFPDGRETGADGSLLATFVPQGGEAQGSLQLAVDGFRVPLSSPPGFSIVSPVDVNLSTLALTNTFRLPADGVSESEILVRIVDAAGNPQPRIPVVVRSSRNTGSSVVDVIRPEQSTTDASGEFRAILTSTSSSNLAGDATIRVEADGKPLGTTGSVNFLSVVSASQTQISVTPTVVPANGTSAAQVTVEVKGNSGQPLANVLVQLETKDNALFKLQPEEGRTDAGGTFRSRISSTLKTGTILDVFADGLKASNTAFVLFN